MLMERLGGDVELVIQAVACLHRNGVPARDLTAALAQLGASLDQMLARYSRFVQRYAAPMGADLMSILNECQEVLREPYSVT
jgi:hypothetical protein